MPKKTLPSIKVPLTISQVQTIKPLNDRLMQTTKQTGKGMLLIAQVMPEYDAITLEPIPEMTVKLLDSVTAHKLVELLTVQGYISNETYVNDEIEFKEFVKALRTKKA